MTSPEELVARARGGDRAALDQLLREMKDLVYNLAIRMLGSPTDAEDASQEILIRLVTGLGSFRGDSSFRTWVYRVASNQLLTTRKRALEQRTESFEAITEHLEHGIEANLADHPDPLVVNEAKLICTSRMLLCLDREHRLAFILGEILELPTDEGAAVLGLSGDAFRKRLSRARARMEQFAGETCGLVRAENPCRCAMQASNAVANGMIDAEHLSWAVHRKRGQQRHVDEIDGIMNAVALLRSVPDLAAPESLVESLRELIVDRRAALLS